MQIKGAVLKVLLAEVPDHFGLQLHSVHVLCLLVVLVRVPFLHIHDLLVLALRLELCHFVEASDVAAEQAAPQSELLQLLLNIRNAHILVLVSFDTDLFKEVVGHPAVIAKAQLLWTLVESAEWAGRTRVILCFIGAVEHVGAGTILVVLPTEQAAPVNRVGAEDSNIEVLHLVVPLPFLFQKWRRRALLLLETN